MTCKAFSRDALPSDISRDEKSRGDNGIMPPSRDRERNGAGTDGSSKKALISIFPDKQMGSVGFAFLLLCAHTVVGLLHSWAHFELHIAMSLSQWLFVGGIVGGAPWLGLLLLRFRRVQLGWMTFLLSMLGSLAFGLYFHFVKGGPDNVAMLRESPVVFVHLFRITAIILALTELFGTAAGFVFYRRGWGWQDPHDLIAS